METPESTTPANRPPTRRWAPLIIGSATLLLLAAALFYIVNRQNVASTEDGLTSLAFDTGDQAVPIIPEGRDYLTTGQPAPPFSLEDLDGNTVSLADFAGQPIIINFWATWCVPCRIEMPELEQAHQAYADDGLVILALNQDEPADLVRAFFVDELDLSFYALLDVNYLVAADYSAIGAYPSTYFVDPDGIVTAIRRGPITFDQITAKLNEMGFAGS